MQSEYILDYGREESYGLAQIHLRAHPHITVEQACDPLFALKWMAEEWAAGNMWKWTCYELSK